MGNVMGAEQWDERYRAGELMWGVPPNRWVREQVSALPPGRAVDLACGEGRNALWLAGLGWTVTAVDFSAVAIEEGRQLESASDTKGFPIEWRCADVTSFELDEPVDLVMLVYLHLPAVQRRATLTSAVRALAPGGVLLVIGHDSANLTDGVGGPQDPAVLFTAQDVVDDLAAIEPALVVDLAEPVLRPVEGADRPAIDALVRAHRP